MKEINEPEENQQIQEELQFSFSKFFLSLKNYLFSVVDIRNEVDYVGSVDAIKKDIDFKGVNVWVLGASIVIASIGLNVNSAAVVIGAMLISPLMGPIVGIGLSIGINDVKMLTRSLKSLGTTVFISVLVSAIYFLITPFGEVQSELIARTKPNLLDVLIAIFGGIALIVAKTQRGTVASVIFGVAIATALMPPLCTAGYGLANGNWEFFFGAFYLFLINSVFITFSTWLIVKYLKFPLVTYINEKRQKKVKNYILIFSLLVMIPSGITFWNTIQENIFKGNAENFIMENFQLEGTDVINKRVTYTNDSLSLIEVYLIGNIINTKIEDELRKKMASYKLEKTKLKIYQSKDNTNEIAGKLSAEVKSGILEEIYKKNEELLDNKDAKIEFLEEELIKYKSDTISFSSIKEEMWIQYKNLKGMTYGKTVTTNFKAQQDTLSSFFIQWDNNLTKEEIKEKSKSMEEWLKVRLRDKKVQVVNY